MNLYLFRQISIAFLFASVAVTFVVLFTQSFRMLSFVIDNSSTIFVFFHLMGLLIPTFLPLIVPISLGVAVLFIYHKFVIDSEIVVMRAAGISPLRLAAPALLLAAFVVLLGYGLAFWVTPAANKALVALQYKVRDDFSAFMIRPGAFNDLADGLTFYARRRGRGGGFEDILVHDVRHPERPVTVMAETGVFYLKDKNPEFVVFNGRRQEVDVASGRLQELQFERYVVDFQLLRESGANHKIEPREMSFTELYREIKNPQAEPAPRAAAWTELHQRLAGPLLSLAFAVIAVAVILAGEFNRRGMAQRVWAASIAIVVIQAAMISLVTQVGKYAFLAPLLYLIILAPVPVGLLLLDAPASVVARLKLPSFLKEGAA